MLYLLWRQAMYHLWLLLRHLRTTSAVPTMTNSIGPSIASSSSPSNSSFIAQTSQCADSPIGWHDSDGATYNSDGATYNYLWYAAGTRYAAYGNTYPNDGFIAQYVCCVCGGGEDPNYPSSVPIASVSSQPTHMMPQIADISV